MPKTVLITGATKGIGLSISNRLSDLGWQVIGIARNNSADFKGEFYQADLADITATENVLELISNKHSIDAIVNNVGIANPEPLEKVSFTNLANVYDLNVRVALQIVQKFLPDMKSISSGRIINISSRAINGVINRTSYSAAKSALIGCTKTWALELASDAITVNAIAPGPIETELFRKTRPVGGKEEKALLEKIPLQRIGKPEDIAAAVEFLISENASFITGQVLYVDGGASI